MTPLVAKVTPDWLSLRESADHRARPSELVRRLAGWLPDGPVVVHDLGSGTGSMLRWLAPQLPAGQHWVLHDLDDTLLAHAESMSCSGRVPSPGVTVTTSVDDVTTLTGIDLAGASVVTASAFLDLLTADELARIAAACGASGCAALFTLSVTGRVDLVPRHPLDAVIEAAFNAHQRRDVAGRRLLGPDAVHHASTVFGRAGAEVHLGKSPWRLGVADAPLVVEWLTGWVAAACEQQPELAGPARGYLRKRLAEVVDGRLRVVVDHADLLALPGAAQVEPQPRNARVGDGEGDTGMTGGLVRRTVSCPDRFDSR